VARPLLDGLGLHLAAAPGLAVDLAAAHLRGLGARVGRSDPANCVPAAGARGIARLPTARLTAPAETTPDADPGAGLPTATLDLATGMALAAGALAASRLSPDDPARQVAVDPDAVAAHVLLPLVLAAADPSPPPAPPTPRPTADGAVCADLAIEDDGAAFGRLLRTGPGAPGAAAGDADEGSTDDDAVMRRWGSEELAASAQ
jgi:hypothetical protein